MAEASQEDLEGGVREYEEHDAFVGGIPINMGG